MSTTRKRWRIQKNVDRFGGRAPGRRSKAYAGVASLALLVCLASCDRSSPAGDADRGGAAPDRLHVVCTTTMIADLARQLGGDLIRVDGIMKPGEDPHVYDVRPRDAQLIAAADLVLMNGLHLESTLVNVIENQQEKSRVVRLAESDAIDVLRAPGAAAAPDPHCWFNVRFFRNYAEEALEALVAHAPQHESEFRERASAYFAELDALDGWVREQIATVPREQRVMVTSHDAFQYYGDAYDIEVHAVIGISTEQQPRPQDMQALENLVRDRNVRALFIETSVTSTLNELVRKIADRTGASIGGTLYSDSLGDEDSPAATYVGMVRHNTTTIVEALK